MTASPAHIERLRACSVVGPALRRRRQTLRLSVAEVAALAGVHPAALARWERGAYALPAAVVGSLAMALRVGPEALYWPRDRSGALDLSAMDPLPEPPATRNPVRTSTVGAPSSAPGRRPWIDQ
jgi:transcriptional regulator with XRE-family HTH domain